MSEKKKKSKKEKHVEISLAEKMKGDKIFQQHCSNANFEPTKRQYSKYLMKKGTVYKTQILKLKDD